MNAVCVGFSVNIFVLKQRMTCVTFSGSRMNAFGDEWNGQAEALRQMTVMSMNENVISFTFSELGT